MAGLALLLIVLSVLSMAGHSVARKWLFNNHVVTESELLTIQSGIAAILCGGWFFSFAEWDTLAPSRSNTVVYIIAIAGTTLANIVIQFANARATRLSDLSFTAPISAMTPGFVVVATALFGELPSTAGYLGILLIIIGAYLHAREGSSLKEYLLPLFIWTLFGKINHLPEAEQQKRRSLRWAYIGALCATLGLTFDGLLARHGNMAFGVTIELFGLTVAFGIMHASKIGNQVTAPFTERFRKYWIQITGVGVCFGLPFVLLGIAFRLAPVAYVGSLKRLSIPLTLMLAWWVLGEMKKSKRRFLTGGLIAAGAIILALDPTQAVLVDNLDGYLTRIFGE